MDWTTPPDFSVDEDLPRPDKHPLHSTTDEESAPAKRRRHGDTKESNAVAIADINGANTQQTRNEQPEQQQRSKKQEHPRSSKKQFKLMCRLKYNDTARMGERAVVVYTTSQLNKNKAGDPCNYSYNLRRIPVPAEVIAMIFPHVGFRTLGKACMGKNTKESKMQGKIAVSSAELKKVIHEHALNGFFARNEIPYSPAMAATLGADNQWAYLLILFRFMLEKGCHGCEAGVYIGCHYWVFGKNFCENCLETKLVHHLEAHQIFAWSFGNQVPTHTSHNMFDDVLECTPHSTKAGRACDQGNTSISPISQRWFLREHVQCRINEFRDVVGLCQYHRMTMNDALQVFDTYKYRDFTGMQNQAMPIRQLDWRTNQDNMADWLEFARLMEIWAVAHDGQEAAGDFTMAKLVTTTISTCMQHAAAN
ncbi:hypothetical protein EG328_004193 [Venturia inaequalis]|uniref:Uncharacterized protein n=1 Tax=Venturia inaequalis TaxID=5025 RepID=A0A8H3URE2_VENIN|nr:hypothetical protein EG328_004193 [Venturia inaequalis]